MGNNNLRYGLGYDWDSTMPGVAALVISLNLGVASAAQQYLEGYILQKWEVRTGQRHHCDWWQQQQQLQEQLLLLGA